MISHSMLPHCDVNCPISITSEIQWQILLHLLGAGIRCIVTAFAMPSGWLHTVAYLYACLGTQSLHIPGSVPQSLCLARALMHSHNCFASAHVMCARYGPEKAEHAWLGCRAYLFPGFLTKVQSEQVVAAAKARLAPSALAIRRTDDSSKQE